MQVLLASTSYPADDQDWRGRFIADMAESLAKKSQLSMEVWAPPGALPSGVTYAGTEVDARWLKLLMQQGGIAHLLRKRGPFALGKAWELLVKLGDIYRRSPADVLHINWLQNALPLTVTRKPALVTVLGSDFALLKLPGMAAMLRRSFRERAVILAPNAKWMVGKLEQVFGDLAEVRHIPFGINPAWFSIERIPNQTSSLNWLAVTRLTPGKLGPLFEWGEVVFGSKHLLHLFGPHQDASIVIPDWVRYHGPSHPSVLRDEWFPQAAGLITLSRHDEGLPQVLLEAMAAGLPVIASRLPAHQEIIQHGETGMLIGSAQELQEALDSLADTFTNNSMGNLARAWISARVGSWDDCAELYVAAYRKLLEIQKSTPHQ